MGKQSEKGNVIELVIIGVLVLGIAGLLVWRFVGSSTKSSDTTSTTTQTSQMADTTSTETAAPSTTKYCLPIEKLCVDMSSTYTVDYSTKDDEGAASYGANVKDEQAVFKSESGDTVATLTTYYIDGLGGGCDVSPAFRITSVDKTSVATHNQSQYKTATINVVKAAIPNASGDGTYRALAFLSTSTDYDAIKDIKACSNTFYADMIETRNGSFTIPNNGTQELALKFEYTDGKSYPTIDEAAQQLSTARYTAAQELLKTIAY